MHRKKIYLPLEFIFLSLGSKVILVRAQIVFFCYCIGYRSGLVFQNNNKKLLMCVKYVSAILLSSYDMCCWF
jgi:hypothetical protein